MKKKLNLKEKTSNILVTNCCTDLDQGLPFSSKNHNPYSKMVKLKSQIFSFWTPRRFDCPVSGSGIRIWNTDSDLEKPSLFIHTWIHVGLLPMAQVGPLRECQESAWTTLQQVLQLLSHLGVIHPLSTVVFVAIFETFCIFCSFQLRRHVIPVTYHSVCEKVFPDV